MAGKLAWQAFCLPMHCIAQRDRKFSMSVQMIDGQKVVRTNCDRATPFLRALNGHLCMIVEHALSYKRVPKALDIGCGSGRNSEHLKGLGFEVKSVDRHADYAGATKFDFGKNHMQMFDGANKSNPDYYHIILLQYVLMFLAIDQRMALADEALRHCAMPGVVVIELQEIKNGKMNKEQIDKFIKWFIAQADVRGFKVLKKTKGKVAVVTDWSKGIWLV
jgi:SAM-dependent methyltransferase